MRPDTSIDYAADAWGKFLIQHQGKPILEGFVKSFFEPMNGLEQAFAELIDERKLETSQGKQLDGVASIVGVTRSVPNAIFLPFFGYIDQPAGRAYGVARYRHEGESTLAEYGLPDGLFRVLIKAKIIANKSTGTVNDILEFVTTLYQVEAANVEFPAAGTVKVRIAREPTPDEEPLFAYFERFIPVAGGIELQVEYYTP